MTQDPFWHPINGAIDTITKDVLSMRNAKRIMERQAAIAQQEAESRQKLQDKKDASAMLMERIKFLQSKGKDTSLTPESRTQAMNAAMSMMSNPDIPVDFRPQQEMVSLHPEVAKFFEGTPGFDPSKPVSAAVAKELTAQYFKHRERQTADRNATTSERNATTSRINANKGKDKKTDPRKQASDLITYYRTTAGKTQKKTPEFQYLPGYYDYLDEQNKAAKTTTKPDTLVPSMKSFGQYVNEQQMADDEQEVFNNSMQTLLDEIKAIKKEAEKLK